jgi:hypothetical protein
MLVGRSGKHFVAGIHWPGNAAAAHSFREDKGTLHRDRCLLLRRRTSPRLAAQSGFSQEATMDTNTLLIILVILFVLGGGFYGRGRWY